jgi:hypothetical protein
VEKIGRGGTGKEKKKDFFFCWEKSREWAGSGEFYIEETRVDKEI